MNNNNKDMFLTTEVFKTKEEAEHAYNEAINAGYKPQDINVLMSEDSRNKYYDSILVKEGNKASTGASIGGASGAVIGGIVAALTAVGTNLIIPGLGLVVAGPLAAGLAGAGAGVLAGGMVGALIGFGVPEDKAKAFEADINSGGILLGVNESPSNSKLAKLWKKGG
jgi:hypothetical protein